jgi:hypothetical protein
MDKLFDANFSKWVTSQDPQAMATTARYLTQFAKEYTLEQLSAVMQFVVESWSCLNSIPLIKSVCRLWLVSEVEDESLETCCRFLNLFLRPYSEQPSFIADVTAGVLQTVQETTVIPCSIRNGCHCNAKTKRCPFSASYYRMKASCTESVVSRKYRFVMLLLRDWSLVKVSTFLSYLGPAAKLDNGFRVQVLQGVMKSSVVLSSSSALCSSSPAKASSTDSTNDFNKIGLRRMSKESLREVLHPEVESSTSVKRKLDIDNHEDTEWDHASTSSPPRKRPCVGT